MSAGSTFERVYRALKDELLRGDHRPGDPLEPRLIGDRLFASITPVRDALHRLAGERLIEASPHDGFRVPLMTEHGLRDLYRWQELLALISVRLATSPLTQVAAPDHASPAFRVFFDGLARASGSGELAGAMEQVGDRLAPARILEQRVLPDIAKELQALHVTALRGALPELRHELARYRAIRFRAVPRLVALMIEPRRL